MSACRSPPAASPSSKYITTDDAGENADGDEKDPFSSASSVAYFLDGYGGAVEFSQTEAIEHFVITGSLVLQDSNRYLLTELHRLSRVRAPVYSSRVPPKCHIGRDLVKFAP